MHYNRTIKLITGIFAISCAMFSCGSRENSELNTESKPIPLPYLGESEIVGVDTIYHTVPSYELLAHDSSIFINERVANKIHVVHFFFTSCPSICPAMIEQMKRLQENTKDIEEITFLSHTVDPKRDTVPKLQAYINDRELDTRNWFFLYGEQQYVYELGMDGYLLSAMEDEKADGGFLHSEQFVLIDREGHIRGMYVGTDVAEVDQLEKDIRKLLKEEYAN